jgi:hypothetical protein
VAFPFLQSQTSGCQLPILYFVSQGLLISISQAIFVPTSIFSLQAFSLSPRLFLPYLLPLLTYPPTLSLSPLVFLQYLFTFTSFF